MKNIISTILLSIILTSFCVNPTSASDIKLGISDRHIQELVDQLEFLVKNGIHQSEVIRIFKHALMQETFNGAPAHYDLDGQDQEMLKTLETLKKIGLIYGGACLVAVSFLAGMGLVYLFTEQSRNEQEASRQRNLVELLERHDRENRALNLTQNPVLIALNQEIEQLEDQAFPLTQEARNAAMQRWVDRGGIVGPRVLLREQRENQLRQQVVVPALQ